MWELLDVLFRRTLPDGRVLDVTPLLFGFAQLGISRDARVDWYQDVWHYDTPEKAIDAARRWTGEGEPSGWMRHPPTGRRRPGGDPAKEYVRL